MTNLSDAQHDNESSDEVESPVDGPTPDWMRLATAAGSSGSSLTEDNTPDWLKSIRAGKKVTNSEATAEAKSTPDSAKVGQVQSGMSDLERLLAEEGIDLGTVADERPKEAEGMSAREWLISTSDDEMIRKGVGAEPMAAEDLSTPQAPLGTPASGSADDGMSDLERLLAEEGIDLGAVADERPQGAEGMSAKEWLISTSDDEMIRKGVGAEPMVTAPQPGSSAEVEVAQFASKSSPGIDDDKMVVEDDLPDWLRDVSTDEEARPDLSEAPAAMPAVSPGSFSLGDDKMVVADDLPDWLRAEEDELETTTLAAGFAEGDEDLPDWLRDVEEGELEAEEISAELDFDSELSSQPMADYAETTDEAADEGDLPDWLKEVQRKDQEQAAMASKESQTGAPQDMVVEDELPDWLMDVQEEPQPQPVSGLEALAGAELDNADMIEVDGLPDWLKEVQEDESEPFEPSEPSPEPFADVVDEEGLPDWLQEFQAETSETVFEMPVPVAAPVAQAASGEDDLIDEEGLPDWLRDIEDSDEPLTEDESILEVLKPVSQSEAAVASVRQITPEMESDVSDRFESFDEPEEVMGEATLPPILEGATPAVQASAQSDAEGDIPDWLSKLREGEARQAEIKARPQPAAIPGPTPAPAPQPVIQAAPAPQPAPQAAVEPMAEPEFEHDLPANAEERLKLARQVRDEGKLDEAVRIYHTLVSKGVYLDRVIEDMQQTIKSYPSNYLIYQVMGDAMMRDGRLKHALDAYRQALAKL